MTTAAVVKGRLIPNMPNVLPSNPWRPKAIRSASPATEGGSTTGKSTSISIIAFPLNSQRASM